MDSPMTFCFPFFPFDPAAASLSNICLNVCRNSIIGLFIHEKCVRATQTIYRDQRERDDFDRMAPIETQQPTEFLGEKSKKNVILLRAFTNMFLYVHLLSLSLTPSSFIIIIILCASILLLYFYDGMVIIIAGWPRTL
jgi:hypothetical protein